MLLFVDNYDSFTWNIVQALWSLDAQVELVRNDALSVEEVLALAPQAVVIGPGPGRPCDAGICPELFARLPDTLPLLGVCLGHQGLIEHYGGAIERDPEPTHGHASLVHHTGDGLFTDMPDPFAAGRYHSLRAVRASLPDCLRLCAWTDDGVVMAVEHKTLPRFGVQFHPESILSPGAERILARFLHLAQARGPARAALTR